MRTRGRLKLESRARYLRAVPPSSASFLYAYNLSIYLPPQPLTLDLSFYYQHYDTTFMNTVKMTRKSSRKSIPTKRFEGDDLDIAPDSPVFSPATPVATPAVSADPSTHLATEPVLQQSVEAASLSPPPPTPSVASTMSSPSSGPATPTRSTRRGGAHWRAGIRATLKQVGQDAIQPAPAQPVQLPAPTLDDEYDINSPHFGLNHTPKWDGEGIDIDDNSKGRWFPSVRFTSAH